MPSSHLKKMMKPDILMYGWFYFQFILNCILVFSFPGKINLLAPILFFLWIVNGIGLFLLRSQKRIGWYLFLGGLAPYLIINIPTLIISYHHLRGDREASVIYSENYMRRLFFLVAFFSILIVFAISFFIIFRGLFVPSLEHKGEWQFVFSHVSLHDFLFSSNWNPNEKGNSTYGILGFLWSSIYMTFVATLIAVFFGLILAIVITELAPPLLRRFIRSLMNLLAGIPSVVYGFVGVILIVPMIRELFPSPGNSGFNILSASIILAFMILPTIVSISEVSINAVSSDLKSASRALGATHWQTIYKLILPHASSGIMTGVILAISRAIGETMAVIMLAGNALENPGFSLFKPARTLTMNIVSDMSYAQDEPGKGIYHLTFLFTTGIVLLLFILLLNITIRSIISKKLSYLNEK